MKTKLFATALLVAVIPGFIGITIASRSASPKGVQVEPLPTLASRMEALGGDTMALMVAASGLDDALGDCGPDGSNNGLPRYTVFVPREAVWTEVLEAIGLSLGQLLAQPSLVKTVLLNHIVKASIAPIQLVDPTITNFASMSGLALAISKTLDPFGIRVNDKPLVLHEEFSDPAERLKALEACNGWAYQIDGVLVPSGGGPTLPPTEPGLSVGMTTSTILTTTPYVPFTLQFSTQVKGVDSSDLTNSGTAPGCSFSLAPRQSEWNFTFSFIAVCAGPGTVKPVFASGGAIPISGSAGPATAATGPEAKIVPGPLVSVELRYPGHGTVTSSPSGIDCGTVCIAEFSSNSTVTLTATPMNGHVFVGWSGACTGTQSCSVSANGVTQVTAEFARAGQLSVIKAGSGQGTVASKTTGINCGSSCSAVFREGTQVTLTATPARGSRFVGWYGVCSGQKTCSVTISGGSNQSFDIQDVFAIFERN